MHPPVVVGLSLLAAQWSASPVVKFLVVGASACVGSVLAGATLRWLAGARRVL